MRKASSSILPDTPSAAVRGKAETAPRGTARRLSAAVLCLICVCTLLPSCGKNESALPAAGEVIPVSGGAVNGETASGAPDTDEAPDNGGASEATGTQEQYPSEQGGDSETDTNTQERTRTKRTRTKRTRTKRTRLKLRRKKSTQTVPPLQLLTHCSCILPCTAQEWRFTMRT